MVQPQPGTGEHLTEEQFILRAIERLRKHGYTGIHTVYSGFNDAFREYFNGADPVVATVRLAGQGKVEIRYAKGGAMLYKPGEVPKRDTTSKTLKQMGL